MLGFRTVLEHPGQTCIPIPGWANSCAISGAAHDAEIALARIIVVDDVVFPLLLNEYEVHAEAPAQIAPIEFIWAWVAISTTAMGLDAVP
jgi:hypothetical protein